MAKERIVSFKVDETLFEVMDKVALYLGFTRSELIRRLVIAGILTLYDSGVLEQVVELREIEYLKGNEPSDVYAIN
ncbi:MAG: hypothetical protein LM558_00085 [Thermosphaera sp.]|nr:hypothetical protein [Thermosphaera sp.]